jgi:nucleotide-binding universal stress UspA family protein
LEGTVPVSFEEESRRRMSRAVQEAVDILSKSGLRATGQVPAGVPDEVLVAEADKSGADCLFVGARGLNALERLMLGSVSTAVALHATCSVEIIRP